MLRQLGRLAPRLTGTLELSAAAGLHTSAAQQGVGIPERRHPLGSHTYPGRFEGERGTRAAALQAGLGCPRRRSATFTSAFAHLPAPRLCCIAGLQRSGADLSHEEYMQSQREAPKDLAGAAAWAKGLGRSPT